MDAFITGTGKFLPNDPIGNDEIGEYLGSIEGSRSYKDKVLATNGIEQRYYAMTKDGAPTHMVEELAAGAVVDVLESRDLTVSDLDMLVAGTAYADIPIPSLGSQVHGRLGGHEFEVMTTNGVCCNSVATLLSASRAVRLGDHSTVVAVNAEISSKTIKASAFPAGLTGPDWRSAEFLRWMLSDGASSILVEPEPRPGLNLRVDWVSSKSHADKYEPCMLAGANFGEIEAGKTTVDLGYPPELRYVRQNISMLAELVDRGLKDWKDLQDRGVFAADEIDVFLPHLSSMLFAEPIRQGMETYGGVVDTDRWYTNLSKVGNIGSPSPFLLIDGAIEDKRILDGDRVLMMIPESARMTIAYVHLTAVEA